MSKVQTDNSFLWDKVELRINNLPEKQTLNVLDAFGGDGRIWDIIRKRTGREINILSADQKPDKKGVYLRGDNRKFLKSINLQTFDVIDLDAYGIPFEQLEIIFQQHKLQSLGVVVFVTAIQVYMGGLPFRMLDRLGYKKEMVKKIPTLFSRRGFEKLKDYLAINGVQHITHRSTERKHYLFFRLP